MAQRGSIFLCLVAVLPARRGTRPLRGLVFGQGALHEIQAPTLQGLDGRLWPLRRALVEHGIPVEHVDANLLTFY